VNRSTRSVFFVKSTDRQTDGQGDRIRGARFARSLIVMEVGVDFDQTVVNLL